VNDGSWMRVNPVAIIYTSMLFWLAYLVTLLLTSGHYCNCPEEEDGMLSEMWIKFAFEALPYTLVYRVRDDYHRVRGVRRRFKQIIVKIRI